MLKSLRELACMFGYQALSRIAPAGHMRNAVWRGYAEFVNAGTDDLIAGQGFAVFHRVAGKKNRHGCSKSCMGVAFYRKERGPIPIREIPARCLSCGQELKTMHLDLHEVLDQIRRAPRCKNNRQRGCLGITARRAHQ